LSYDIINENYLSFVIMESYWQRRYCLVSTTSLPFCQ